jgi:hypothetical protein
MTSHCQSYNYNFQEVILLVSASNIDVGIIARTLLIYTTPCFEALTHFLTNPFVSTTFSYNKKYNILAISNPCFVRSLNIPLSKNFEYGSRNNGPFTSSKSIVLNVFASSLASKESKNSCIGHFPSSVPYKMASYS